MVYLVSHTWANRFEKGRRRATIEAYSNCDSVLLYNDLTNEKATFLGRKKEQRNRHSFYVGKPGYSL